MIKTILFDADDTLFDFKKAERTALSQTLLSLNIEPKDILLRRYSEINLAQWKLLEQKKISRDELRVRRFSILFQEFGIPCKADEATLLFEKKLGECGEFFSGAEELLQRLHKKYRLYIVSNGASAVQRSRLKITDAEKYFDGIFISQEVGYDKPDIRFFEACFQKIPNFCREETLIIGDSLSSDIQGGKNAGLVTVWYNRNNSRDTVGADFEIHVLDELEKLLKK